MRRFAVIAVVALVFGLITATTAVAGNGDQGGNGAVVTQQGGNGNGTPGGNGNGTPGGNDDGTPGGNGSGPGEGQCDGAGPNPECDQQQERQCADPDVECDRDPAADPVQQRERDRIQECADGYGDCANDPGTDPLRQRDQMRRQVWQHLGDGPCVDSAELYKAMWTMRHQYRLRVQIML